MEIYYPFTSLEEKQRILDKNNDKTFLRNDVLSGLRFLVFDDGQEPPFDFPSDILKAFARVVIDEINAIRAEVSDLKTRVAILDGGDATQLKQRTADQLKEAIKARM